METRRPDRFPTAARLARDFSALVLVARNRSKLDQTAEAVKAAGAEVLVIDAELAEPSAAQAVVDESPDCYKRLPEVLAAHGNSIRILHTLTPVGVAMAGANEFDPYKD